MPKRIIVSHYGGPEALQLLEEDCPEPRRGEVRVKVLAAGVALPTYWRAKALGKGGVIGKIVLLPDGGLYSAAA